MPRAEHLLSACLILALIAGCGEGPTPHGPGTAHDQDRIVTSDEIRPPVPHEILDQLVYEEVSGTIGPDFSGILPLHSETWPGDCWFGLDVPEGAIQYETEFSIRIPDFASYMEYPGLPLIVRLAPEGTYFPVPVTVMATWMPWAGRPPLHFWNAEPVYDDEGHIIDTEYDELGRVEILRVGDHWQVHFSVHHFSDWEVGDIPEAAEDLEFITETTNDQ